MFKLEDIKLEENVFGQGIKGSYDFFQNKSLSDDRTFWLYYGIKDMLCNDNECDCERYCDDHDCVINVPAHPNCRHCDHCYGFD